jgi:hypothetical protein
MTQPNDTMQVVCHPAPVSRGQPIECDIALLPHFHFVSNDPTSVQVTATEPEADNEMVPDSTRVHDITRRGTFSGTNRWSISGKAIFNTWITVHAMIADDSNNTYAWTGGTPFFVTYSSQAGLTFPHTTAVEFKNLPDTEVYTGATAGGGLLDSDSISWSLYSKTFGRHYGMVLDNGMGTLEAKFATDAPLGTMTIDSAVSGPDSGFKYVSSTLALADGLDETTKVIDGDPTSRWVADQEGVWEHAGPFGNISGINGLPICTATPTLWSTFGAKVRAHEGITSGQISHQSIWVDRTVASGQQMAMMLQRMYFPNGGEPNGPLVAMNSAMRNTWFVLDSGKHQSLDATDNADAIARLLGCYFDNDRRH